jgi:hypothetical protein
VEQKICFYSEKWRKIGIGCSLVVGRQKLCEIEMLSGDFWVDAWFLLLRLSKA